MKISKKQIVLRAWVMLIDALGILDYVEAHKVSIDEAFARLVKAYNQNCKITNEIIIEGEDVEAPLDAPESPVDAPQSTSIDKPSTDTENAPESPRKRSERTKCSTSSPVLSNEQIEGGITDETRLQYCKEVNERSKTFKMEEGGKKPRKFLDSEKGNQHYTKVTYAKACTLNAIYKKQYEGCYACTVTCGEIVENGEVNEVNKRFADDVKHFFNNLAKCFKAKIIRVFESHKNGKLHTHAIFYTKDWITPEEKDLTNNKPAVGRIAQYFEDYCAPIGKYTVNVSKDGSAFQYMMKCFKYNTGNFKHILECGTEEEKEEARKAIDSYILTSNIGIRQLVTSGRKGLKDAEEVEPETQLTKSPEEGEEDATPKLIKSPKKTDFEIVCDFVEGKCAAEEAIMPLIRCIRAMFKPCTRVVSVNMGNNEMPEGYKYKARNGGVVAKMKERYVTIPQERGCEGCPVRDWYLKLVHIAKEKNVWEE